jgi:two-component system, sensor histidine kinase and response regulator
MRTFSPEGSAVKSLPTDSPSPVPPFEGEKAATGGLHAVRSRLMNMVLSTLAVVGAPVLVATFLRSRQFGWPRAVLLYYGLYLVLLGTALFGRRLPFLVRALLLTGIFLVYGASSLFTFGLAANGLLLLGIFCFLASLLFEARWAALAIGLSASILGIVGVGFTTGTLTLPHDTAAFLTSPYSWLCTVLTFAVFVGVVVACSARLQAEMKHRHEQLLKEIVERKRADGALRASESKFRLLVQHIPQRIFLKDIGSVYVSCNEHYAGDLGIKSDEIAGKTDYDFYQKELAEKYRADDRRIMASGATERLEERYVQDGRIAWISTVKTPVYDSERRIIGILGIFFDITDQKEAREALCERVKELECLHRLSDLIENKDHLDPILQGAVEIIPPSWLYPQDASARITFRDRSFCSSRFQESPWKMACDLIADGIEVGSIEVYYSQSKPDRDEGPFLKEERTLLTTIAQRLGKVVERIEAQELMREGKRKAEMLTEAKTRFLVNVSHELRTPLNGIIGMVRFLAETPLSPEQRDYVETLHVSSNMLLDTVSNVIDISQIEAGKLELESIDFDLRSCLEDVGDMLAPAAAEKGLEFAVIFPGELPEWYRGDPGRLRQVLANLAANAVKFTEQGEVLIRVSALSQAEGQSRLKFDVMDTGIGISEAVLPHVFESFSQADASTTRKYGGTGLGLTVSKRIMEALGGTLGVESSPGRGSVFSFEVVLERSPRDAESLPPPGRSPVPDGTRALVADEHAATRESLGEFLRAMKIESVLAADGEEALATLRATASGGDSFAFALIDYRMLGPQGSPLVAEIRADPTTSTIPLISVTPCCREKERDEALACGFSGAMGKPPRRSGFFEAARTVLGIPGSPVARTAMPTGPPDHRASREDPGRIRILLVEDSKVNQKVTVHMLKAAGYPCDVANNGREGVEAFSSGAYGLVIMDCQMPVMDGFQATAEIRNQEAGERHTPIVALTADAVKGNRERCLKAGMDDYLTKPVLPEILLEVLEKHIRVSGTSSTDPAGRPPQSQGESLDVRRVQRLAFGDRRLERELIGVFEGEGEDYLRAVRAGVHEQREDVARKGIQELKGCSALVGALALHTVAAQIEAAMSHGDWGRCAEFLPELTSVWEETLYAFRQYLGGKPSVP